MDEQAQTQVPGQEPQTAAIEQPKHRRIPRFVLLGLLFLLLCLIGAGAFVASLQNRNTISQTPKQNTPQQIACSQEAKQCPNGSYVSRHGPKCQFDACPQISSKPDETAKWQDSEMGDYSYSIKRPRDWLEFPASDIGLNTYGVAPPYKSCQETPLPSGHSSCTMADLTQAIYITTYESVDQSIDEFVKQKIYSGAITYKTQTIDGVEAKRTSDISSQYPTDNVFIKEGTKLYRIQYVKSPSPVTIPQTTFEEILPTFKGTVVLDAEQTRRWQKYTEKALGYSFEYPTDFKLTDSGLVTLIKPDKNNKGSLVYIAGGAENGNTFQERLDNYIQTLDAEGVQGEERVTDIAKETPFTQAGLPGEELYYDVLNTQTGYTDGQTVKTKVLAGPIYALDVTKKGSTVLFIESSDFGPATSEEIEVLKHIRDTFSWN